MNLFPTHTRQIHFWSRGKIPNSAYMLIKKHQAEKNKQLESALLEEWIVNN